MTDYEALLHRDEIEYEVDCSAGFEDEWFCAIKDPDSKWFEMGPFTTRQDALTCLWFASKVFYRD